MRRMRIRYAVAGKPIHHTLSPLLISIVSSHLKEQGFDIDLVEIRLLESTDVNIPMAWAWVTKSPPQKEVNNRLYGDISNTNSFTRMTRIAEEIVTSNIEVKSELTPFGESFIKSPHASPKTVRGEVESWISLTSPLKHMLSTRSGIHPIDNSLENGAVNQLRWNGNHWYCAGTDGRGLVAVAQHFGFDFEKVDRDSPLLCLNGGGGAARSSAAAWAQNGGKIWSTGGRRKLGARGPWADHMMEGDEVVDHVGKRLLVDFDLNPGMPLASPSVSADLHVISSYNSELENQVIHQTETGISLDGRWLLTAQHLYAWADLFEPLAAEHLPGLGQTMHWLNQMESALRAD